MPTEPELKSVHIDNFDMTYVEQGDGKPVVFLHGGISDHRTWDRIRPRIAQSYRVICPDLRYFGVGEWQDKGEKYGQQAHADDVAKFIRSVADDPVTLVGWSYGGAISMITSIRNPELVSGMFLYEHSISTFLTDPEDVKLASEDRAQAFQKAMPYVQAGDLEGAARQGFDGINNETGFFERLPSDFKAMILENARTMPLMGTGTPPLSISADDLRNINVPTRIVVGENTRACFQIQGRRAADLMPAASFHSLGGCVHASLAFEPDQFADALIDFLKGI